MSATRGSELPLHRLDVPLPHLLPFAIGTFDSIGPLSRAGFPHRHTFYEIVLVTGGSGAHVLDLAHWPLDPPHLCVITPGQVHHWEDADDLTGHVMLFNEDFLLGHPEDAAALDLLAASVRQAGPAKEGTFDFVLDVPQTPTPTATPTGGGWPPGTSYRAGDRVTYGSTVWTCRQAHVAVPGWEPPNVPALWRRD